MIKKIRNSLTLRICLLMSVLLLLASGVTYAAVAKFLPVFYSNRLDENLDELSRELTENLSSYQSIEEAMATLQLFTASTEMPVAVLDQNGMLAWPRRNLVALNIGSMVQEQDESHETEVTKDAVVEGTVGIITEEECTVLEEESDVLGSEDIRKEKERGIGERTSAREIGGEAEAERMVSGSEEVIAGEMETEQEIKNATVVTMGTEGTSTSEKWDGVITQFLEGDEITAEYEWSGDATYSLISDAELSGFAGKDASAIKSYDLKLGDTDYMMLVAGDMQSVNQTMEILYQIFPYIFGLAVFMALVFALVGSFYLTAPVVRLSRISRKMAALDFSDKYQGTRKDELGELGRNLNEMARNLSGTLENLSLANKKLKSDIELERELERKRIAFFSAVSHELKTPITILKGHISGMLRGIGAYRDRDHYLLRSQETTEKMEEMVGELLTVSRMESNTFVTQIVDLAELLREQIAEMTELIEMQGLALAVDVPEHLYAEVNSGMMEKVFRNLLTNAIRYTPANEGNEIRIFLQDRPKGIVCRTENTGVQIPDASIPHLFDAFYRVESSRSRRTGGSGLGLYIVRMALEQHGARCGVENIEDGVRFFFEIPKSIKTT